VSATRADRYHTKAEKCREQAGRANLADVKEQWERLAAQWERLAEEAERRSDSQQAQPQKSKG
jgi:hypothetical protein